MVDAAKWKAGDKAWICGKWCDEWVFEEVTLKRAGQSRAVLSASCRASGYRIEVQTSALCTTRTEAVSMALARAREDALHAFMECKEKEKTVETLKALLVKEGP